MTSRDRAGLELLPLILPGPPRDRERADGWRQWRLTRHDFVPAPRLAAAAYKVMSPRDKMLHDLHRAATHANLAFQETPMSAAVSALMRSRIHGNALKHNPTTRAGLMISGGGYQGKTETACEVAAEFEDQWLALHQHANPAAVPGTRDLHIPVAYAQTPVTAKPKSCCQAILGFFGAGHKNMTLPQLIRTVRASLHDHGTKVLILDDVTRLKMHRADDQDTLDLIRSLMSMNVTLILIGVDIPRSGLLGEGRPGGDEHIGAAATQTARRFDLITLDPFRYDSLAGITAWARHLIGIEQQLRLLSTRPGMLTGGVMPEYLFRRTGGVVGRLERLIEDGATLAMDTGTECLTETLLDKVTTGPAEDTTSGAARAPAQRGRRRPRNTAFDDHGPAPGGQAP